MIGNCAVRVLCLWRWIKLEVVPNKSTLCAEWMSTKGFHSVKDCSLCHSVMHYPCGYMQLVHIMGINQDNINIYMCESALKNSETFVWKGERHVTAWWRMIMIMQKVLDSWWYMNSTRKMLVLNMWSLLGWYGRVVCVVDDRSWRHTVVK